MKHGVLEYSVISTPHVFFFSVVNLADTLPFANSKIIPLFCKLQYVSRQNALRWLIIVVSPQRPGFDTWAVYVYVRFMVAD